MATNPSLSRRRLLGGLGGLGALSLAGCAAIVQPQAGAPAPAQDGSTMAGMDHSAGMAHALGNILVGDVDPAVNGFDPSAMLTDFDYGQVSTLPSGQTLREYQIYAADKVIQVAPGISFPAWTYNGRVPGPAIRCTEGDRVRITFTNGSTHPHSIHFHGFHAAEMDGVTPVAPGAQTVYEFDAAPFGLHVYHCHVPPFMRHIHKGLYGTFIIDPKTPRPPARELLMVMNAFDTNFDGENEIYAVNTVGFHYTKHPIPLRVGELVRIYLSNFTEFDPINSFHLHANLFNVYRTGTRLEPSEFTDVVTMGQAERHILEFTYDRPGQFMFHAHQSEFNGLGWMGIFEVTEDGVASAPFEAAARLGICQLS
jgi:FtsP/CotA-like multicopper oxidase with cupredoxin domain